MFSIKRSTLAIALSGWVLVLTSLHAAGIGLYDGSVVSLDAASPTAMYTTTVLGGLLFGSNVGLTYTPDGPNASLTTTPSPLPAGLYAATLDMTFDGTESYAGGSLLTGMTHIVADSVSGLNGSPTSSQVSPYVELTDGLTFHVAGGGTAQVGVSLSLDGGFGVGASEGYSQALDLYMSDFSNPSASASFKYQAVDAENFMGIPATSLSTNPGGWVAGSVSVSNLSFSTVGFSGLLQVTDGENFQFLLEQGMSPSEISVMDTGRRKRRK